MTKAVELIFREWYGVTEKPGKGSNPKLIKAIKTIADWATDDSTVAWCAIFISYIFNQFGFDFKIMAARQFLNVGMSTSKPQIGDLVILKRGNQAWQGHVGLFIREDETHVWLLGGNQRNQVNISAYSKKSLLGYRRLLT